MASTRKSRRRGTPIPRLAADERRRDLLRVAAGLLTRGGVDALQIGDVATAGGVSRQFVYRFFPSRQAIIQAVLEDFVGALTREFGRRAAADLPRDEEQAARVFVEAVCDTIEAKGAGPWHLLDSKGPDPALGQLGQTMLEGLVSPWHAQIARVSGLAPRDASIAARVLVAAGRAILDLWIAGELTRDEAVRYTTRGVSALLAVAPRPRRR